MTDDLDAFVWSWLGSEGPCDVLLWTGAGVSADAPTGLPLGETLVRRTFRELFDPSALETILDYHQMLRLEQHRPCDDRRDVRLPRLETVLGIAVDVHGLDTTMQVLADFREAAPNALHRVMAAHLGAGGHQLTANFDDCIERSNPRLGPATRRIFHFHGSFAADPSGAALGATLRSIETGFSEDLAAKLRTMLQARPRLVVLGYSGSDYFDVDPAIEKLASGALRGHSVLWVAHVEDSWSRRDLRDTDAQVLRLLARAGAQVSVLCAPTRDVCDALVRGWSLSVTADPLTRAAPVTTRAGAGAAGRSHATFQLYRRLGLHPEVKRMVLDPRLDVPAVERFRATTDLLWEEGRFASARRRWRKAPKEIPAWERAERIGACLWEQGRLIPAYLWLARHARRQVPNTPEHLRLSETSARVVLRMVRGPDTRWLGRRLVPHVRRDLGTITQAAGIDLFRRANDVIEQLDAVDDPSATANHALSSSEWFLEEGDVSGLLAYRHSYYRRTYRTEVPTETLAVRYRELQADKECVGAIGARVMLLPGAEHVYSVAEFLGGLRDSQFAPWHRFRLLARFVVARGRSRRTRRR